MAPCSPEYVTAKYEERLEEYYQNKDNSDLQGYQKRLETVKLEVVDEIGSRDLEIELARIRLEEEAGGGGKWDKEHRAFLRSGGERT